MKIKSNRLIVVLGMHRSGTSAITRGLQVMGLELGDRLILGIEGNNTKGFWEDFDFNGLNDEMLQCIGSNWFHLAVVESSEIEVLRNKGYFLRAVELLLQKVSEMPKFAFKDPRIAKLLPFWKEVFEHCNFDVCYVLSIRHPLSVAKSLGKRDDIEVEHAYLLWLGHVLTSLIYSADNKRILIDYDRLMQSPEHELTRIAKHFELEVDSAELQNYKTDFLDNSLRHTFYELNTLSDDQSCPEIVRDVYSILLQVATDQIELDSIANNIARWSEELEILKSPLKLIDKFLAHKVVAIQAIAERDADIVGLIQAIADRDADIVGLRQAIADRDADIVGLRQAIADRDGKIDGLNRQFQEITFSTSWKLTKPVRFVGRQIAKLKQYSQNTLVLYPVINKNNPVPATNNCVEERQEKEPRLRQDAAFEVLSGLSINAPINSFVSDDSKLIAFYLPQYHRTPENSEWWGPGFTEWTNVVKAKPNFDGHYQPHLPRELGFYDLDNVEVMREQAEMAKLYGVGAFCFYYYWFSGRRILEKPIDNFHASDIDIDYCLCWANENWTRTWDGDTKSVLMHQKYDETDPLLFITSLVPHFSDKRYIKVNGKPMLVVYRAKDIPDVKKVFSIWRKAVVEAGFPGLHIAVVDFYDISTPMEVEADALVEFPPHKFNGPQSSPSQIPTFTNSKFTGGMVEYAKMLVQSARRPKPDFDLYRGIIPSWDNTARRQDTPTIVHGATPKLFWSWLSYLRAYNRETFRDRDDNFIFINAWNEWGEGCHLEPDQKWGLGYLEAVSRSAYYEDGTDLSSSGDLLLRAAAETILDPIANLNQPNESIDKSVDRLLNTLPVGRTVQKAAFKLRNHPFTYQCGRSVYRLYRKVIG